MFPHFPSILRALCRVLGLLACILPIRGSAAPADPPNPYVHHFDPTTRAVRFELRDLLQHPHFTWPRTLLRYRVRFDGAHVRPGQLRLVNETSGADEPFQLSEIKLQDGEFISATVNLICDLPSGAQRAFVLRADGAVAPLSTNGPTIKDEGAALLVDTGKLQARFPKSRDMPPAGAVPGPILQINSGHGWMGDSQIVSDKKRVRAIRTDIVDQGPLFALIRITCTFDGGGTYIADIKAISGYDFLEVSETMDGLPKEDNTRIEQAWTRFAPTQRDGKPMRPETIFFRGEDPAFVGPPRVENLARDFYYWLAPNAPDSTVSRRYAGFVDTATGQGLGVGVLDAARWDDREYAIWASSPTLALRFRYADGILHWRWPLVSGTRQTAVIAYDANASPAGDRPQFVSNRFGGLSLDRVKDWVLTYPDTAPTPASMPHSGTGKPFANVETYLDALWKSTLVTVEGGWINPVELRIMHNWVVPEFQRLRGQMTPAQRERATALLLFTSYAAAREEVSPLRKMLGGHPNFMADWKYPLAAGAFLFPDHPLAHEWADEFEKMLELCSVFYVRPDVPAWDARGGRWTESLGIYNFAFLDPANLANRLCISFDGRNRFPIEGFASHAQYLTGVSTAPLRIGTQTHLPDGTPLTLENGFERSLPPQGAHAGRREIPPSAYELAERLMRYRPLGAEHLLWAASRSTAEANRGTNPRLTSAKYTGYGIVLRAAVGTSNEVSVFLPQIDKGPNYRWGFGNEGGCGDIYYYARGKSFAGHLGEDAGDRRATDADLTCNTGVYKDYTFRGIGMNDLTGPFYDLEVAQFAELLPRSGSDAYSWPEYARRDVMLVGEDYLLTFDEVNGCSRVSWSTVDGEDEKPNIISITGEVGDRLETKMSGAHNATATLQRWDPYKASGDRLMLVSHLGGVQVPRKKRGDSSPVVEVRTPGGTDSVILQRDDVQFDGTDFCLHGRAGIMRKRADGTMELALFQGTKIGSGDFTIETDADGTGVSATLDTNKRSSGTISGNRDVALTVRGKFPRDAKFYVDGSWFPTTKQIADGFNVTVHRGTHRWALTTGACEPMPPQVVRAENHKGGARIHLQFAGDDDSQNCRIEVSRDTGLTWQPAGETDIPSFELNNQPPGKLHVRAVALNGTRESRPSADYPIYISDNPPPPPDGLKVALANGAAVMSWGRVLGTAEYHLYRRPHGETAWTEMYHGPANQFTDVNPAIIAAFHDPGLEAAAWRDDVAPHPIYEYAVAAADDLGESEKSSIAGTDPALWRNWNPDTALRFKRRDTYWQPPYVREDQMPPPFYP